MDGIAISISHVSVLMHDEKIPGNKSPDIATFYAPVCRMLRQSEDIDQSLKLNLVPLASNFFNAIEKKMTALTLKYWATI